MSTWKTEFVLEHLNHLENVSVITSLTEYTLSQTLLVKGVLPVQTHRPIAWSQVTYVIIAALIEYKYLS